MFQSILNRIREFPTKIILSFPENKKMLQNSRDVVEKYNIQKWFTKIPAQRAYHQKITQFIAQNFKSDSTILESGCGIGQTFCILARYGFKNFIGVEVDHNTFLGAKEFLMRQNVEAQLYECDGLDVLKFQPEDTVDIYLPLNWTYFTSQFDKVFEIGRKVLKSNGIMIVDFIRNDYVPKTEKEKKVYNNYPYKYSLNDVKVYYQSNKFEIIDIDESDDVRVVFYLRLK